MCWTGAHWETSQGPGRVCREFPPAGLPKSRHKPGVCHGMACLQGGELSSSNQKGPPPRRRGCLGHSASAAQLVLISMWNKQAPGRQKQILCHSQTFKIESNGYRDSYCLLSAPRGGRLSVFTKPSCPLVFTTTM